MNKSSATLPQTRRHRRAIDVRVANRFLVSRFPAMPETVMRMRSGMFNPRRPIDGMLNSTSGAMNKKWNLTAPTSILTADPRFSLAVVFAVPPLAFSTTGPLPTIESTCTPSQ